MSSLGCPENETQIHLTKCKPILDKTNLNSVAETIKIDDLFGSPTRQKVAVLVFKELLETRDVLLKN